MRYFIFYFFLGYSYSLFGQDTTDVTRLKNLSYMEYRAWVKCDTPYAALDFSTQRYCLNLEFQRVDSILNVYFIKLLERFEEDSIQTKLIEYQRIWVLNRRMQSQIITDNSGGNVAGIIYLNMMIIATVNRIEEIEYMLLN